MYDAGCPFKRLPRGVQRAGDGTAALPGAPDAGLVTLEPGALDQRTLGPVTLDPGVRDPGSPSHQRAEGALIVTFKQRDGSTVLDRLRQDGCLKARLPRVDRDSWTTGVIINSSGGVAAGDQLSLEFRAGEGTQACLAGQAAERFYRSVPGGPPARLRTRIAIAPGAALEWLPQEAILFNNASLDRRLEVEMAADGWFLGVEALVFGRHAMGEQVRQGWLRDLIRVRRGGALLLHDAIRLDGEVHALLSRPAIAGQARALATLVLVAPDSAERLEAVRTALAAMPASVEAGASAWNGMLLARVLAPDGALLRRATVAALDVLRDGRALPRAWSC